MSAKKVKGFKENAERIARKEGMPVGQADAVLAASSRGASKKAKEDNPNLRKVKMAKKKK